MQEVSFEDALEIITIKDPRCPREAYLFVREALDFTQRTLARDKQGSIRHVTGQELLSGIKDYAAAQFGPMAMTVLEAWGIHSCQDFGELVFRQRQASTGVLLIRLWGLGSAMKASVVSVAVQEHGHELPGAFAALSPGSIRIRRKKPL